MNKLLTILIILLMIPFSLAVDESGEDYNGGASWDFVKDKLSFFDKGRLQPFTIVNGGLCSDAPDHENHGVVTGDSLCWNNIDGGSPGGTGSEHNGVFYKIFQTEPWRLYAETEIKPGERICLPIESGREYYRYAYYCDDTDKVCNNYVSVCNTLTGVQRERYCPSTGEWETVIAEKWQDPSVGDCAGTVRVQPESVPEDPCPGCVPTTVTPKPVIDGVTGTIKNIYSPTTSKAGEEIEVSVVYTVSKSGKYLLETGIEKSGTALSISAPVGSVCDGNEKYSGTYVEMIAGKEYVVDHHMLPTDGAGTYTVYASINTGCFSEGGKNVVDKSIGQINVISGVTQQTRQAKNYDYIYYIVGFIVIVVGILLIVYSKKRKRR